MARPKAPPTKSVLISLSIAEVNALEQAIETGLMGNTIPEVIRNMMLDSIRRHRADDTITAGDVERANYWANDELKDPWLPSNRDRSLSTKKKAVRSSYIKNRRVILRYSEIIITALQQVLNYDPIRQHNQPPPDLWIEGDEYLDQVRSLILELQRLNSLLEATRPPKQETRRQVVHLAKHFDKVLGTYSSAMGKVAAGLTGGVVLALLSQTGIGQDALAS